MPMPHRPALRRHLLLSATAIALLATPLQAQDNGVFQMLGRIIFGAGSAKLAIDTPQAVSALDQDDLDRGQPETIGDLFKSIPGVEAAGASARALGQAFNIRGIGNAEQTASESRIAVTVDGAPKFYESYRMGSFFGDIDLYKRVEVLRGPASSTLYGAGAIGGAIAFTTKDPADFLGPNDTTALKLSSGYSSNGDGKRLGAIWAQRFGDTEVLAALNHAEGSDMQDGDGVTIPGTAHASWSGLLKGVWHIAEDQRLSFATSRTDTKLDNASVAMTGDLVYFGPNPGSAASVFGTNDIHAIDETTSLSWDKGDLTVQLSHTKTSADKSDFSMAAACSAGDSQVLCDSSYAYATTALKVENSSDFSFGQWQNSLTFGAQLSSQDRTAVSSLGAMPFHPEGSDQKLGLYAQGEFVWNDRLTLIPGVRIDFGALSPSATAAANGGRDAAFTAISPKLAALYKLNDNLALFGSLAHTERMPSLDELYQYNPTPGRTPVRTASMALDKEQAETVELGLSWQDQGIFSAEDSLQVKVTGFNNSLTDKIVVRPSSDTTPGQSYYQNLAAARIWGVELEAGYDAERWFGQLAYSSIGSKDKATGLTLADTPAQNLALTLGAKLPDQNLVLGWRGQWFGEIKTSSVSTSAPNYNIHDLFVTWSPKEGALAGLDVNFTVENVFDASYRNNLALDKGPGRNGKLTIAKSYTW
jgi:hemoglobin/transferrin/lactoferrin receptor protein